MEEKRMRRILVFLFAMALIIGLAPPAAAQVGDDGSDGTGGPINPGAPPVVPQLLPDPPAPGCTDTNLQTLAVASRSGGGSGDFYGPQLANDGAFGIGGEAPNCCGSGCWHWISAGTYPTGSWYELEWPAPVSIGQIFVDTKPIPSECGAGNNRGLHGADVQTWDGSDWVDQGSVTDATDDWGFVFPGGPVLTTRLRLNRLGVVSAESQNSNPILYELKVYECYALEEPSVGGSAIGQLELPSENSAVPAPPVGGTPQLFALAGFAVLLAIAGVTAWGARRRREGSRVE
jgi:hypothetical protein